MNEVLYLGPSNYWGKVNAVFRGTGILVRTCSTVDGAENERVQSREEKIDLFLCEVTLEEEGDGIRFAKKLRDRGHKVMVFSKRPIEGFPFFEETLLWRNHVLWLSIVKLNLGQ